MNNITSCIICGGTAPYFLTKDTYPYHKCDACTFVFIYPKPEEKTLTQLYTKTSGYQAQKNTNLSQQRESKKDRVILEYLSGRFPHGTILDVGCSNGQFLYFAKQRGLKTQGVEINEHTACIGIKNGLNIHIGTLADVCFPVASFDVIFLGDVLEHLSDPKPVIAEIWRILKPNGVFVVSTPNLDCFWSRTTFKLYQWFGIPWSSLTPPHHVLQFSQHNAQMFLEERGFRVIKKSFFRHPRLMYELGSLHLLKKVKEKKSFKSISFLVFSFTLYIFLYMIDYVITPFKKKDFTMVLFTEHA